ncbi:MAG: alanine racemase [Candidatus Hydrogenedentota bacterium]
MERTYTYYKRATEGHVMPFAFVDLDLFDRNIRDIQARANGKSVRVASKSIRSVPLIERILQADSTFKGIMAYSVREAVFLSHSGLDDILVAYPAMREVQGSGVLDEMRRGKQIVLMIDSEEHVHFLDRCGREMDVQIPVCMDLDMSTEFPGLHFGVWRSPVRSARLAAGLTQVVKRCDYVRLDGLMGYEAQIAGLPDNAPSQLLKNTIVRFMKSRSIREIRRRRADSVKAISDNGVKLRFVNGGGTGSVESTSQESDVTEVAVGSGFFSPVLFDWYRGFKHHPAAGFAIEITRKPTQGLFTCSGGGYVASGPIGKEKLPCPYLPDGATLLPLEGAGEVQTPIRYAGKEPLDLGDPVFMRYSKAGEMCERFNSLLLIAKGEVVDEVPTYRGEGQFFI